MDRDSLLVDITSPEVLISIGGEPVSVGIAGAASSYAGAVIFVE